MYIVPPSVLLSPPTHAKINSHFAPFLTIMKGKQKPHIKRLNMDDGISPLFYNIEVTVGAQGPRNRGRDLIGLLCSG